MHPTVQTAVGVVVLILAACFDALGYNIQRRDHCKNNASAKPRHECYRIYWHLGFYIYIASSLVGAAAGLQLINAHCIAPIITSSLVFNVIFARYLVGSAITRRDLIGTGIVLLAIMGLLALTAFTSEKRDDEMALSTDRLKILFSSLFFIISFGLINLILAVGLVGYFFLLAQARKGTPQVHRRDAAILISVMGGLCASETIIFAKSGSSILRVILEGNWATLDAFSALVLVGLISSALFQLYCLNAGLKLADSVLVGPIFSSVYNVFALFNTLIFLKKYESYPAWSLFLMCLAIVILVSGIIVIATQLKPEPESLPKLPSIRFKKSAWTKDPPASDESFNHILAPSPNLQA